MSLLLRWMSKRSLSGGSARTPMLDRHLERAGRVTGQSAFRFPEIWEDSATLAARSAFELITRNPSLDTASLRHLIVGTETGVDHSKACLRLCPGHAPEVGLSLPTSLSSFQTQHACAGGTFGLLSVASLLAAAGRQGRFRPCAQHRHSALRNEVNGGDHAGRRRRGAACGGCAALGGAQYCAPLASARGTWMTSSARWARHNRAGERKLFHEVLLGKPPGRFP